MTGPDERDARQNANIERTKKQAQKNAKALRQLDKTFQVLEFGQKGNDARGALQRLQMAVPTENTMLSMGQKDTRFGFYNGFNVSTDAHFLSSANGPSAKECAQTLEARGAVVVQSMTGSVYASGMKNSLIGSGESVMIAGGGGAVIAGCTGAWSGDPVADRRSGAEPTLADAGSETASTLSTIGRMWAGVDGAVAAYCTVRDVIEKKNESRAKGLKGWLGASIATGLNGVSGAMCATIGIAGMCNSDPIGGTVVHGDTGVVIGSKAFTSAYGAIGLTAGSLNVSWVGGGLDCSFFGITDASLSSKTAVSLISGKNLQIVSKGKAKAVSRAGNATLEGKEIHIGAGDKCATVGITSDEQIGFDSMDILTATGSEIVHMWGKELSASAKNGLGVSAGKRIALGVGSAHLLSTKKQLQLGVGSALPKPPAGPPPEKHGTNSKQGKKNEEWSSKQKEYHRKLAEAKASWKQVVIQEKKIEVKCGSHGLVGTGSSWKFDKNGLVINK